MDKQKFIVDFDLTIVHSIKAYCTLYNSLFSSEPNFIPANYKKINRYDLKDECPLVTNIQAMFANPYFFRVLEFINEDTYEVLEKLNKKYQLIVCSIGTPRNIALKTQWLEKKLPFIKDYVLITNETCKMNKSIINMQGAIFMDDIPLNLESSNAEIKFLFGEKYSWNNHWEGEYCKTWSNVAERFL